MKRFTDLLTLAELVSTTKSKGPFTVFVPADAAFDKFGRSNLEDLVRLQNRSRLKGTVSFHVVSGDYSSAQLRSMTALATLNGQRLSVSSDGDVLKIGKAKIVQPDIRCGNGVIHIVDAVDQPASTNIAETLAADGRFKQFLIALDKTELLGVFKAEWPFTLLAPTDEAIGKLPPGRWEALLQPSGSTELRELLLHHTLQGRVYSDQIAKLTSVSFSSGPKEPVAEQGGRIKVGTAQIVRADIEASNGVIHVIDALLPTAVPSGGVPPPR